MAKTTSSGHTQHKKTIDADRILSTGRNARTNSVGNKKSNNNLRSASTMTSTAGVTRNNQLFTAENPPKLEDILQERYLYSKFHQFLDECLCVEYLLFYKDVLAYRTLEDSSGRKKAYSHILKKYFWSESEYEINIPHHVKQIAIQQGRNPEGLRTDSLDATAVEAAVVLKTDCLSRFFKCPLWLDYLENRPDSPEAARSRRKLNHFFGETITGPLKREDIVKVLKKKGFEKNTNTRRVTNMTEDREERRRFEMAVSYGLVDKNDDILRPEQQKEIEILQRTFQKKPKSQMYEYDTGLKDGEVVLEFKWSWKAMDYRPVNIQQMSGISPSGSFHASPPGSHNTSGQSSPRRKKR
eukprot:TRINITY_DN85_c1_g2_i1.p1 TRINITY_DN85_c1_g2~~TRINITY_DN85_c1_g2_i1.p1  ORF type:complete len:354 (-),score=84.36 TRINITY_DN85_c1_g2_i1:278-1339(-)